MMVHGILLNIGQSVLKVMFNIGWPIIPIYEIVPTFWCWLIFLSPPFIDVNCNSPPARPRGGTWDWPENFSFGSFVEYTCGPFARFKNKEGQLYEDARVECFWNKTFSPSKLDACQGVRHGLTILSAISCEDVPLPPQSTGLLVKNLSMPIDLGFSRIMITHLFKRIL